MLNCPKCDSGKIVKNGMIHNAKQNFKCSDCGRQFVENPTQKRIPQETWMMVDKLLLEKIPLAGISRVTGISELWLQKYVNIKYESTPQKVNIVKKRVFDHRM